MSSVLRIIWDLIASVWMAVTLVFIGMRLLPGDAVIARSASGLMSAADLENQRQLLGLDLPFLEQYIVFWRGLLFGDFGTSFAYGLPAHEIIAAHIAPTIELALAALAFALVMGTCAGVAMSSRHRMTRYTANIYLTLALAMPIYWTGILAVFFLATRLDILPATGSGTLAQLVLPASVLGFHASGSVGRVLAATLRDVPAQPHVTVARSKGLTRFTIWRNHIMRLAIPPVINIVALQAAFMLSGTVVTEAVFARTGLGNLLLNATLQRDYPVVQGIAFFAAILHASLVFVSDLVHVLLDPRVHN